MINTRTWLALLSILALALAACGEGDTAADDPDGEGTDAATEDQTEAAAPADIEEITLNVATLYGPEQWQITPIRAFADAVTEASGGAISFEFFYGDTLVGPAEFATALQSGLADIATVVPVYSPDVFPVDNWISQAGFVASPEPPVSMLESAAATLDWSYSNPEQLDEFREAGLLPLFPRFQLLDQYDLLCRDEPVRSLDEASGVRVRVGGPAWVAEANAVGMSPEVIAGGEMYEAFQRGIVDCIMGAPPDLKAQGFWEIGEHYTDATFAGFSSYAIMMSADTWDGLSLDAQRIMWDALPVYWEGLFTNVLAEQRSWVVDGLERGIEFHAAEDDLLEAIDAHHDRVLESMRAEPPASVSDPDALLDDYVQRHEHWRQIIVDELGYEAPGQTWQDWVEQGDDLDLGPWVDRVVSDILERHRP
jgi:TRAP-type C4-dicarboxylate transport system substrate-binding protein